VRLLGPDGVIRPHPDPVRNGSVLPHLLGQLLLDHEGLVRRLRKPQLISSSSRIRYRSNKNHTHTHTETDYLPFSLWEVGAERDELQKETLAIAENPKS
jgi:hypothetical protein